MTALADALDGWTPDPVETVDAVGAWDVAAFSGMLDLPGSAAAEGEAVPPLWHWFAFLDHPAESELGDDGHPAHGHFLPPVPDRRRMFAGGRLRVDEPIRVGVPVRRRTSITGVNVKSGRSGEMAFVTLSHAFHDAADDRHLLTEEQDIVYRSQPAGTARGTPAPEPVPQPAHDHAFRIPATPQLLFRFSALTYNTHRIHYDREYATGVEGYPGLVVQGPLLAMLALEIPRRHRPDAVLRTFDYRLTSPAFDGADVWAAGSATADGVDVAAGSTAGPESMLGSVTTR
ncbi:FAS1-like dehydratase domain-containing protein [Pseudonocardia endophytica]|uniref:3-methylfumaryl-CoA hydratase n=1 Tax=Pseudonocardia endophytica TaxID=401976 RepID=A0A4R1HKM3_PSEEN|nr:MaoC family dehydratase N-terminal domain-containing protein [Pseudonocardia endophytica]TCK21523.1 3-methylfumaryl-CoA hydratase [Pseudonocardia endophytica]